MGKELRPLGLSNCNSTAALLRGLVDVASMGGNLLLDIGPKPDGTFPQPAIERLDAIGRWMAVSGESIYGTGASSESATNALCVSDRRTPTHKTTASKIWRS